MLRIPHREFGALRRRIENIKFGSIAAIIPFRELSPTSISVSHYYSNKVYDVPLGVSPLFIAPPPNQLLDTALKRAPNRRLHQIETHVRQRPMIMRRSLHNISPSLVVYGRFISASGQASWISLPPDRLEPSGIYY
ncbi:hypothetical protein J6590_016605 [Homalodisca vitripennis]|nr:hypothetical protein J6590_016605 [Homalodisca vitripennis]